MIDILSIDTKTRKRRSDLDKRLTVDQSINLVNYIKYVLNHVAGYILSNKSSKRDYNIEELQNLFNHYKQPTANE